MKVAVLIFVVFFASSALADDITEHILFGVLAAGSYDVKLDGVPMLTAEGGFVTRFSIAAAEGPHAVSVVPHSTSEWSSRGCGARPRSSATWSLNMCIGFYTTEGDTLCGYVEFYEGVYFTAGGISFGSVHLHNGDTYMVPVNISDWSADWSAVRDMLGVPPSLCCHTLRGQERCLMGG